MTNPARLLLVDDEVAIQRTLAPLLRSRGYEVDVASTGNDALRMIADREPHVIVRRVMDADETETGRFRAGDLAIDDDRRRVLRGDVELRLTPKEFELLSLLARNQDRVLTHRALLKAVWGPNAVEQPEHLWTLVALLRKKIEPDPAHPR